MINGILIFIAIIFFMIKVIDKQKKAEQNSKEQQENTMQKKVENTLSSMMKPAPPKVDRTVNTARVQEVSRADKEKAKAKIQSISEERVEGESMTAFLDRKAKQEANERKLSEWKTQQEEKKSYGTLQVGKELPLGAPVPKGNVVKVCPYCGAENLVPYGSSQKFHCFFCRTSLPK